MVTAEKQRRLRRAAEAWLGARPELARARRRLRRDRRARRPRAARAAGVLVAASNPVAWPSRRTSCTRRWTSTSRGRRPSCPSASGRSTSTGSTRTTASSSRSSWRCCSTATSRAGDHVLDPFAGSGTTLVQALESGLDATGVDIAAFNCLLMRVKTAPYDLPELGEELRDVVRAGRVAAAAPETRERLPPRVVRAAGRRRAPRLSRADPGVPACRRPARDPLAGRAVGAAAPPTSISRRRRRHSGASTGATSTGASAGRSSPPPASSAATRSTRSRASRSSRASATTSCDGDSDARGRARGGACGAVRRDPHLAAVSGA